MFRRRRNDAADDEYDGDDLDLLEDQDSGDEAVDESGDEPAPESRRIPVAPSPEGPWDAADAPEDGVPRVDLGGLHVPVTGGHELRVDVEPETGAVVSVTMATPTSAMQVAAFAAPRTAGIWAEVREEIRASLADGGGGATEVEGAFGTELHAHVPTAVAGQLSPARFLGVDGPRWFLRAMIEGQAATDTAADPALIAAFGQIVVHRGIDAMVVRDPVPLRLPPDAALPIPDAEPDAEQPSLSLPERGPEITETR